MRVATFFWVILSVLLLHTFIGLANDHTFYMAGNHLVPVRETDISVQKEILTIKVIEESKAKITVYYEFFNPGNEKEIIVGFNAIKPGGDRYYDQPTKDGKHPYMEDFKIDMNGVNLPYEVALLDGEMELNKEWVYAEKSNIWGEGVGYNTLSLNYIYHFKARFKKGLNTIKHTYKYNYGTSVINKLEIDYALTPAMLWANKQIDDFTLILDLGSNISFKVANTFFKTQDEWTVRGDCRIKDFYEVDFDYKNGMHVFSKDGILTFHKKNFRPEDELFITSSAYLDLFLADDWEDEEFQLPFDFERISFFEEYEPRNDFERRLLRNLPFARNGYIFKDKKLSRFFKRMYWYLPNPNALGSLESLTKEEQEWLKRWDLKD